MKWGVGTVGGLGGLVTLGSLYFEWPALVMNAGICFAFGGTLGGVGGAVYERKQTYQADMADATAAYLEGRKLIQAVNAAPSHMDALQLFSRLLVFSYREWFKKKVERGEERPAAEVRRRILRACELWRAAFSGFDRLGH